MDIKQEEVIEMQETLEQRQITELEFSYLRPQWTGRDPRLIEGTLDAKGLHAPGCYRTLPAPTYD